MSRISLLVSWIVLGVIISFQSTSEASVYVSPSFNFTSKTSMLQVASGIIINVYEKSDYKTSVANATLIKTDKTTVKGSDACNVSEDCSLQIVFTNPAITLELKMKYEPTHISGYWEWTSLTIDGTIGQKTITPSENGDMNVTPRPGFTKKSKHDISCQRDYTICAPLGLSWTCDEEEFKSKNSSSTFVKIKFPGLELQPFIGGQAKPQPLRFGSNWDCDPLISSALWVSLLIGLGLIFALYWACDMLSSIHGPDRFDDPKGNPIMVPTTD